MVVENPAPRRENQENLWVDSGLEKSLGRNYFWSRKTEVFILRIVHLNPLAIRTWIWRSRWGGK